MALTEQEKEDFLNAKKHPDELDNDLRRRLGEELDDPNSEISRVLKDRKERGKKMAAGDLSWINLDGLLEACDEMYYEDRHKT